MVVFFLFHERAEIRAATLDLYCRNRYVLLEQYNLFHSTHTEIGTSSIRAGGGYPYLAIYQRSMLSCARYSRKSCGML